MGKAGAEDSGNEPVRRRPNATIASELIEATVKVIDNDGEVAVRVQDIVSTVGVPIPVLYRIFGNREGLIHAAQLERLSHELKLEVQEFTKAVATVNSAQEFRALVDASLESLSLPQRRGQRWKRVNVLGSTYGRPELAAAVARIHDDSTRSMAALLILPQRRGWLRDGLDLEAFAAWFAGLTTGRVLIELGESTVNENAFDEMTVLAVRHVLFG